MMTQKEKVTQDELYKFLLKHDVKLSRLADMIGVVPEVVLSCFKHHNDWHGRPRKFNAEHIALLNDALQQLAEKLMDCRLEFGSASVYTNKNGNTYDPALIDPIKRIGKYLNITGMLQRVLGWSPSKKSNVLSRSSGKMAGHISMDDVVAINAELQSIANVLSGYEIVLEESFK